MASLLRDETTPAFMGASLSAALRDAWTAEHGEEPAPRRALQEMGNAWRREERGQLARMAVERVVAEAQEGEPIEYLVLDGIRNTGEIEYLRDQFGERFFLFAIDAPAGERWDRIRKEQYEPAGHTYDTFVDDDRHDRDEETIEGQQVQLCVDLADVFINNTEDRSPKQLVTHFVPKLEEYVGLLTGDEPRYASRRELLMNMAYSSANSSKCIKRQVGAIIASPDGETLAVGYNENPDAILPCIDNPAFDKRCHRDNVRDDHFRRLAEAKALCPKCKTPVEAETVPAWTCQGCGTNLANDFFFPDRAMNWCTALHAEERAIINARSKDLTGAVLYTTAFPCFLCAEKIIQAGIKHIVFTEAYPDPHSGALLDQVQGITIEKFEGVRSGSFDRIFGRVRAQVETRLDEERSVRLKSK
jgi:deoxycytidylate deaminase